MGSLNRVELIGHLGADPEIRRTNSGKPVVTFRIATSENWQDKNTGERRERTHWHSVVIFNEGLTKIAEQYLKKGSQVYVSGQLQTRKWQDQNGQDRYTTEVVLPLYRGEIVLLGTAADKGRRPVADQSDYGESPRPPPKEFDDDIPF